MHPDGTWNVTVQSQTGERQGTFIIASAGDSFTGEVITDLWTAPCENGKVDGNTLTWTNRITEPMAVTVTCRVAIDGDDLTGEVDMGSMGRGQVWGSRA